MPLRILTRPDTGTHLKMGRLRPLAVNGPRLSFDTYAEASTGLPAAPETEDYSVKPAAYLKDILGNDKAGDCTVAAAFHIAGALLANADQPIPQNFSAAAVLWTYYRLTGGQDNGMDEVTVLNYWRDRGLPLGRHRIAAWAKVNATDVNEVKSALWLFENLYITTEMPDAWVKPVPDKDGFTWGMNGAPNPDNGHAFCSLAYTTHGLKIDTWGLAGLMPWDALAYYASPEQGGALYTVLSTDALDRATAKAPSGYDFKQLTVDINLLD